MPGCALIGRLLLPGLSSKGMSVHVTANFYDVLGVTPHVPFRFAGHEVEAMKPLDLKTGGVGVLGRLRSLRPLRQLETDIFEGRHPLMGGPYSPSRWTAIRNR